MGGQSNTHAKIDVGESVGNGVGAVTKLLRALRHGAGTATAAGITTPISDGDLGEGEDLIVVWRDDELLNMLSRRARTSIVSRYLRCVSRSQLVELLLT
jgi:hypothetical protein